MNTFILVFTFSRSQRRLLLLCLMLIAGCAYQTIAGEDHCPPPCSCTSDYTHINCKGRNLHAIPKAFPQSATSIDLSSNQLTEVPDGSFSNLTNLSKLYLKYNKISSISNGALVDCGNLAELYLTDNILVTLHTSTFYKTVNLKILDVSENELTAIPSLRSVSQLKYLYLGNNKLTSFFFPDSFHSATRLQRITLSNNPLVTSINKTDFLSLSRAVSLTRLFMSRCAISSVEPTSFAPVSRSLISLSISHNPIHEDTLQTILTDFANSATLTSLDLSSLSLENVVKNTTFTVLGRDNKLATLVLSANPRMSSIEDGAFSLFLHLATLAISDTGIIEPPLLRDNELLKNLDLSSNSISRYVSASRFPPSLTRLMLNGNRIAKLINSPFEHLTKLTILNLKSNGMQEFGAKSLEGLSSVVTLDLSDNALSYLPNGAFDVLGSLSSLDLSKNSIKTIRNPVLNAALSSLTTLDLSSNGMQSFHPSLFSQLQSLTKLNLRNNKLGAGFSDPNLGSYTGFLSDLKKLQIVDMSFNSIEVLPSQMISGTSQLDTLNLGTNSIYSWDAQETFKGSVRLKKLILNSNRLALFNKTSFSYLQDLTLLDLTDNPFACTCDMRQFRDWLKSTNVTVNNSHTYTCASPPSLVSTHVIDYDMKVIQCVPTWIWIIVGVGAGVLIVLVFICIAYRYRWMIKYRLFKCMTQRNGCSSNSNEPLLSSDNQGYKYAAFISQCSKEACEDFICGDILPRIDNNTDYAPNHGGDYPIVHQGLYDIGESDLTNIHESLTSSAATIVFVCKHYSSDRRCEMELHESLSLQEKYKKSIIVILSEEGLPMKYVPKPLHSTVSRSGHIEWKEADRGCLHRLNGKLAEVWSSAGGELDAASD